MKMFTGLFTMLLAIITGTFSILICIEKLFLAWYLDHILQSFTKDFDLMTNYAHEEVKIFLLEYCVFFLCSFIYDESFC